MATAGILAGGAGSRMGRNKALMDFRGKPLIRRQIELLSPMFDEIIIGANDPAPYAPFGLRVVPDLLSERCALTGIHALLKGSRHDRVFVVACDMPFLDVNLIASMLKMEGDHDALVLQSDRGLEPLHSLYGTSCIPAIEESTRKGTWKATDFHGSVRTLVWRVHDHMHLVEGHSAFFNANTPEEWRAAGP